MQARDSSGRKVSLLNDDYEQESRSQHQLLAYRTSSYGFSQQSFHPSYLRSASSSPNTPELLRSDSYDSHMSNEPITPLTPMYDYSHAYVASAHEVRSPYEDYPIADYAATVKRPSAYADSRTSSYEDDVAIANSPGSSGGAAASAAERSGKRYPCRYRDSHGCEKTFTTSGHASRHSKIHTAEKAVPCAHPGCSKKFTRADNMKQHLETHYKDKSSRSGSGAATRPSLSSADRRSSSSSKSHHSHHSHHHANRKATSSSRLSPLPSPIHGAWDMRGLDLPILNRPPATRTQSSGLDALAMAVACQNGA